MEQIQASNDTYYMIIEHIKKSKFSFNKSEFSSKKETLREEEEEYKLNINNPHDKIYRKILSRKKEILEIINSKLKDSRNLKEEELEIYNSSYISKKYKNQEADIVYRIKNTDTLFLIEHQTKIDTDMPKRILNYQIEIMEEIERNKENKKSKIKKAKVVPIVIYTGGHKWTAKTKITSQQERLRGIPKLELGEYLLVNTKEYTDEELWNKKTYLSKQILQDRAKSKEELAVVLERIIKEGLDKEGQEFLNMELKYILRNKLEEKEVEELIKKLKNMNKEKEGGTNMVYEMLRREEKKAEKIGEKFGREENKKETAIKLLKRKMGIEDIEEITGLSRSVIQKLKII